MLYACFRCCALPSWYMMLTLAVIYGLALCYRPACSLVLMIVPTYVTHSLLPSVTSFISACVTQSRCFTGSHYSRVQFILHRCPYLLHTHLIVFTVKLDLTQYKGHSLHFLQLQSQSAFLYLQSHKSAALQRPQSGIIPKCVSKASLRSCTVSSSLSFASMPSLPKILSVVFSKVSLPWPPYPFLTEIIRSCRT